MVDELQRSHFLCSLLDSFAQFRVWGILSTVSASGTSGVFTESETHVDRRSSSFQDTKGSDHRRRHSVLGLVDLEVLQRPTKRLFSRRSYSAIVCTPHRMPGWYNQSVDIPFRLRPPVLIRWYLDLSESIALRPRLRSLQLKAHKYRSTRVPTPDLSWPIQCN